MATDVERLIVALEARTKAFENALLRANSVADKRAKAIEARFAKMNANVSSDFIGLGKGLIAAAAGSVVIREFARMSDAATRINNSLKVAGLSGEELERVYQRLSDAAKENGAPIESLAVLYSRATQSADDLGVSQDELMKFTENVALSLRVGGKSAEEASGALLQLSQVLGGGIVQAEEYNSLIDGAQPLLQAVAAGLEEAGGSVSTLTRLVKDGKVSSQAFFRAFEAGAPILEEKAANATMTLDQATTNLSTSLIGAVREFNDATGVSARLADGINAVADAIGDMDVGGFIDKIRQAKEEFEVFLGSLGNADVFADFNKAMGRTDANGALLNPDVADAETKIAGLERELKLLQERIATNTKLGFSNEEALARIGEVTSALAALRAEAASLPATISGYKLVPGQGLVPVPDEAVATTNGQMGGSSSRGGARRKAVETVTLNDFKLPPKSGAGGKSRENEYQRETKQIQERTAALAAETAAMARLNPLVDDFGYSLEAARAKQDLLTAAQQAGVKITPEVEANIDALVSGYAEAASAAERLAATQDKVRERAEFMGQAAYDAFSELIPQIETGNAALDKFLNTLIEAVAQSLLLGKGPFAGKGGGGGLLGSLFKLFPFADGGIAANGKPLKTFASGGISRSAAIFGEAGAEAAVPLPDGRRIPVDLRAPRASRQTSSSYTYAPRIDARGASIEAVAKLERVIHEDRKNFARNVSGVVSTSQTRKGRP